jgi:hypothetical protein
LFFLHEIPPEDQLSQNNICRPGSFMDIPSRAYSAREGCRFTR